MVLSVLCLMICLSLPVFANGQKQANASSGASAGITLHYMWWTPAYKPYISKAVNAFEQKNPGIKVKYNTLAFNPYWQKIQTLYASGLSLIHI